MSKWMCWREDKGTRVHTYRVHAENLGAAILSARREKYGFVLARINCQRIKGR